MKTSKRGIRRQKQREKIKALKDVNVLNHKINTFQKLAHALDIQLNQVRMQHEEMIKVLSKFRIAGRTTLVFIFLVGLAVSIYVPKTLVTARALETFSSKFFWTWLISAILYIVISEMIKFLCSEIYLQYDNVRDERYETYDELNSLKSRLERITLGSSA